MLEYRRLRRLRLVVCLVGCWLTSGLLAPVSAATVSAATAAAQPFGPPGSGPVAFTVPLTSRPHHGLPPGQQPPVEPPRLHVQDQVVRPNGGGGGGTVPPASNLFLLPGLAIGDTSFELFFDAPDTGWTQGIVSLATASDPGTVLHQASFAFADLQRSACDSPARLCVTLRNAEGWTLDTGRTFITAVTLAAADGTRSTPATSDAVAPRQLPTPPPVPTSGLRGGAGTGSTGRTADPVLRGFGVNTATGAFTQHSIDAVMSSSFPINVSAERTYSSEDTTTGLIGVGWAFSYDARVFPKPGAPGQVVFRAEDGTETTYMLRPDGSYQAPAGVLSRLSAVAAGGWQVTTHDQHKLTFDAAGRLLSIVDSRGKGITLSYDAAGLSRLMDAGGRLVAIHLENGRLSRLTLADGRSVRYRYANDRLASVRNPDGAETTYAYDARGRLFRVTDALGHHQIEVTYDAGTGRVRAQKDNLGEVTTFTWDPVAQVSRVTDPDGVVITDHFMGNVLLDSVNGNADVTVLRYDSQLNGRVLADPLRHQADMAFDGGGNVTSSTLFGTNRATEPGNVGLHESSTYDAGNNLLSTTDGRQKTATFTYNQFNQPVTSTDREGHTGRFDYFPDSGLLHTVTDPLGHVTTYAYDKAGNKISQTDPVGAVTTFRYDASGRLVATTDPRGNVKRDDGDHEDQAFTSRARYDGEDRLVRLTDALGHTQESRFDAAGRLLATEDGNGFTTRFLYNDANQLLKQIDPDGRPTSYTYTAAGRNATTTDGAGDVTRSTYDAAGRLQSSISPRGNVPGADPAQFTTTFHYDFNGNLTSQTHPFPGGGTATTQTGFDSLNQSITVTDPLGRQTRAGLDQAGNQTSLVDPTGSTQSWAYDGNNRVASTTTAAGATTVDDYDAAGRLDSRTTQLGEKTTFAYDAAGHEISTTTPRGNVAGADPARFTTRFQYDLAGNRVAVTDPLGSRSTTEFDAVNNVVETTDPNGHSVRYRYDGDNRVVRILGPDADESERATVDEYDRAGNLIEQMDPLGHETRSTYDGAGRLSSTTDALGRTRRYAYDADGNKVTLETARATSSRRPDERAANTITQSFDILGRLTRRQLGAGGAIYAFGYDAANQRISLADATGVQTRKYDAAGRLTEVARGTAVFTYGYDANGNLVTRGLPDGSTQTLAYDADNRPTTLTAPLGPAVYHYDQNGNLVEAQLPGGSDQKRAYDASDRLSSLADLAPGGGALAAYTVARDRVGNPTRLDTTQGGTSRSDAFTYDAANRLTAMCFQTTSCQRDDRRDGDSQQRLTFTYDLVGNRLSKTTPGPGPFEGDQTQRYRYDAANELLRISGESGTTVFRYDADGNQIEARTAGTSQSDVHYGYNLDNQLTSVADGSQTTVYTVDAAGNRIAAATTPASGGATTVARYRWDVNNQLPMLASEQSGGGPARSYTYDPGGGPLSLQIGSAGFLYQPDAFGNTAALTDLGGAVQQQFAMTDPFGEFAQTTPAGNGAPDPRLKFQGQYADPLSGTYHLRAREYVTRSGQFGSVDPLARDAGLPAVSAYVYAQDNPLTGSDPSGLCSWNPFASDFCPKQAATSAASALSNLTSGVCILCSTQPPVIGTTSPGICPVLPFFVQCNTTAPAPPITIPLPGLKPPPQPPAPKPPAPPRPGIGSLISKVGKALLILLEAVNLCVRLGLCRSQEDAQRCPDSGQPSPAQRILGIPVLCVYQSRTPKIYVNDSTAQAVFPGNPSSSPLHFESSQAQQDANRRDATKGVGLCTSGVESRDEYPYASSKEGDTNTGRTAQVMCVPISEQTTQQNDLRTFYRVELGRVDNAPFYVLPVPW